MLDPFRFTARLTLAMFVIFGYLLIGMCESLWYAFHGRPDAIAAAFGDTGRGILATIAAIFRK